MKHSTSSPRSQRPLAITLLVATNLAVMMAAALGVQARDPSYVQPAGGILVGELIWITLWASLSDARVFFRWGLLFGAVCVANLEIALLPIVNQLFHGSTWQWAFGQFRRGLIVQEFVWGVPPCLAVALAVYAFVLPTRRLRDISVGTGTIDEASDPQSRQFRIVDLMILSFITAAPLAIIRNYLRSEQLPLFLLFFAICVASGLLFGIPVFAASLVGRRTVLWTPLSLCFILAVGWLFSEVTFRTYGNTGGWAADFRVWAAVLLPASTVICLNNFCLQALGIRLIERKQVPNKPSGG